MADLITGLLGDISYKFIGTAVFGITYVMAWIGGVAITIEAWLVATMLAINQGVFQSQIVQKGFAATLSVANLGFVLGIIIIAIATILHSETYGYKKLLVKLVAAAILVNFSLVIMAPIFTLANSFTTYFLNCIDPGVGCNPQPGVVVNQSGQYFASQLSGAFNPQVPWIGGLGTTTIPPNTPASAALGQSFGQMLVPILSIGFVAFEMIAICIVLGALVVMLLIRYIYIAILAVLMPFAWLGWVFPNINDWWKKWWSNFFRWTFFAPIVVFFLWLAMSTAISMSNGTAIASQQFGTYTSQANPSFAPIANFITNAFAPIIGQVLNILVLIGLTMGGLIVADKMSIAGAGAALKTAQSVGKGVGNFANKQRKKAGRAAYNKLGGENLTKILQRGTIGKGVDTGLKKVLGQKAGGFVGKYVVPTGLIRRGESYAGQALSRGEKAGGEDLVEHEMKWAKEFGKNPKEAANLIEGSLSNEKRIALLRVMTEGKDLEDISKIKDGRGGIGGVSLSDYIAANQKLIEKDYGQWFFYNKDLRKGTINAQANGAAQTVIDKGDNAKVINSKGEEVRAIDNFRAVMKEFVENLKQADGPKLGGNYAFDPGNIEGDENKANKLRMKMFLQNMAVYNQQMVAPFIRQLKGKQQKIALNMYEQALKDEDAHLQTVTATTDDEKADLKNAREKLRLATEAFPKILRNLASGSGARTDGAKTEEAPAAPDDDDDAGGAAH